MFVGVAMVLARLKKQPEIHPVPKLLGFAALPVNSISFDQAFHRLIGHEGGYSDDRRDPGNWTKGKIGAGILKGTKYGLAANTYPNLDIKNLTLAQAKEIYKKTGGTSWVATVCIRPLHSNFGTLQLMLVRVERLKNSSRLQV
jgi:hypothetical protein